MLCPDSSSREAPRDDSPPPSGSRTSNVRSLALAGGGRVDAVPGADGVDTVHVRSADGASVLRIRMTADGPVVMLEGAHLELSAARSMTLRSEELLVQAGRARVEVLGDLVEQVGGDVRREAAGDLGVRARRVEVEAVSGDAILRANDDVSLRGERVRLNSDDPPMPLTMEEHRARQRALAAGPRA